MMKNSGFSSELESYNDLGYTCEMKKGYTLLILLLFMLSFSSGKARCYAQETPPPDQPKKTEEEKLPLIIPDKKPGDTENPDVTDTPKVIENIRSGIADVFKAFGYKGDIAVPDDFIKRIAFYIHYFSEDEKGSRFYKRSMNRGNQYFPMIKEAFEKFQLPPALIYIPIVESGFHTGGRSHAGAVGMWQFMKGTARMYGLKVTRSIDERKDPAKATEAAARYLNDLLAMFGMEDPFLGICAYNAGEGKILNALRNISYTERSFWTLVKKGLLHNETDQYIPQLIAVTLMNRDPGKYLAASNAINSIEPVNKEEEEDEEIIDTLHGTRENSGEEKAASTDVEKTPAVDTEPAVEKEEKDQKEEKQGNTPTEYSVKKGETVFRIAKRFGVTVKNLQDWNNLRGNNIYPGQKLILYSPSNGETEEEAGEKPVRTKNDKSYKFKVTYTVNYSDALARIALYFKGMTARDIMNWNRLRNTHIKPGQKLVLHLKESPRKILVHTVKQGETAKEIAREYKLKLEFVLSLNGLLTDSYLKPGQHLKIFIF